MRGSKRLSSGGELVIESRAKQRQRYEQDVGGQRRRREMRAEESWWIWREARRWRGPSCEAQRRVTGARRGIADGSITRADDVLRGVHNEERLGFFDIMFFIAIRGFFVRHNEEWVGVRHNEDKVWVRRIVTSCVEGLGFSDLNELRQFKEGES
ncbi:uncharacterized protein DS421_13g418460 [Arachis hypogaea]|nr:uncharacterized protein DS421_13g418460 [Arachis hypogaea]